MIWITCQLGAREHYAIPRALHQAGSLHTLITDAWVEPTSSLHYLPGRLARPLCDRYHPTLHNSTVHSFTWSLLALEARLKVTRNTGWPSILTRNQWFQRCTLAQLKRLATCSSLEKQPILFSYSYTALQPFRYAKQQGWRTVLGQIDPGIGEEKQVTNLQDLYGQNYQSSWAPAPDRYWDNWRQECQLADRIVVNSNWSQTALIQEGIAQEKISVVPLAYETPGDAATFTRQYPSTFTKACPLKVLCLGQVILRKGIAALIESLPYLAAMPIEIWLVGATELNLSAALQQHPQLKWIGQVPRSEVQIYYQKADLFLFATHSDGFGLTQLEAQVWKLPIIASRFCGEVVKHGSNGLILPEVSGAAISEALLTCLNNPSKLQQWADNRVDLSLFSLPALNKSLQTLVYDAF